jgi:hypothetical protein
MPKRLTSYGQKTVINFDKTENIAHIPIYEKIWRRHLEDKLELKPVMDNDFDGIVIT